MRQSNRKNIHVNRHRRPGSRKRSYCNNCGWSKIRHVRNLKQPCPCCGIKCEPSQEFKAQADFREMENRRLVRENAQRDAEYHAAVEVDALMS